jgi:hypothetical protein
MPQLWQIRTTEWINPAHIVHIEDHPELASPILRLTMSVGRASHESGDNEPYTVLLDGPGRRDVLRYIAQAVTPLSR